MTEQPQNFDGIAGLKPREHQVIAALSIGLKKQVLRDWAQAHPGYKIPREAGTAMIPFAGDAERVAFFIKTAKGIGPKGSQAIHRYRPMLEGFERYNLDSAGNPWGQTSFLGYLPSGTITKEVVGQDAEGNDIEVARVPYYRRQRKAQKLGRNVMRNGRKKFERVESYRPPFDQQAPSGQAECRGDGRSRTRWEPDEAGRWGWREGRCLNHDCPFAEVCPPVLELTLHSDQEQAGQSVLARYESHSANTAANLDGFFLRIARELEEFQMDGQCFGLPVRLQIEISIKGGRVVLGKQLEANRFPVVKIAELVPVVNHRRGLIRLLEAGRGSLALPAPTKQLVPPDEERDSMADFDPESPGRPRVEVVPVEKAAEAGSHAEPEVIEGAEVEPGGAEPILGEKIAIWAREGLGLGGAKEAFPPGFGGALAVAMRRCRPQQLKKGEQWYKLVEGDEVKIRKTVNRVTGQWRKDHEAEKP